LAVYTTVARRAAGATEDVMIAYLPIVLDGISILGRAQLLDGGIFGGQQLAESGDFILRCPQLVAMMVQVRHGKAMAPLQNGQGGAGIAIQPVHIIPRINECSFFLLQARTTLSIEAREAKQKQTREFTSCAIFSESSCVFRAKFKKRAPSKKAEVWLKSAWLWEYLSSISEHRRAKSDKVV
jgi:hypothetical protein